MDPLTFWELGDRFDLMKALTMGTLPGIYEDAEAIDILSSYTSIYLREEIQAEAATRMILRVCVNLKK